MYVTDKYWVSLWFCGICSERVIMRTDSERDMEVFCNKCISTLFGLVVIHENVL